MGRGSRTLRTTISAPNKAISVAERKRTSLSAGRSKHMKGVYCGPNEVVLQIVEFCPRSYLSISRPSQRPPLTADHALMSAESNPWAKRRKSAA